MTKPKPLPEIAMPDGMIAILRYDIGTAENLDIRYYVYQRLRNGRVRIGPYRKTPRAAILAWNKVMGK